MAEAKKRGPGRPKGSKNTKSNKKSAPETTVKMEATKEDKIREMQSKRHRDRKLIDEIWSVTIFALGIFLIFTTQMNTTGAFGQAIHDILKGLFGVMAYVLPYFLIVVAVCLFLQKMQHINGRTTFFTILIYIMMCSLNAYRFINDKRLHYGFGDILLYYRDGVRGKNAGAVGMEIASLLVKFIGKPGLIILALALILISILLVVNTPISQQITILHEKWEEKRLVREMERAEYSKQMESIRASAPAAPMSVTQASEPAAQRTTAPVPVEEAPARPIRQTRTKKKNFLSSIFGGEEPDEPVPPAPQTRAPEGIAELMTPYSERALERPMAASSEASQERPRIIGGMPEQGAPAAPAAYIPPAAPSAPTTPAPNATSKARSVVSRATSFFSLKKNPTDFADDKSRENFVNIMSDQEILDRQGGQAVQKTGYGLDGDSYTGNNGYGLGLGLDGGMGPTAGYGLDGTMPSGQGQQPSTRGVSQFRDPAQQRAAREAAAGRGASAEAAPQTGLAYDAPHTDRTAAKTTGLNGMGGMSEPAYEADRSSYAEPASYSEPEAAAPSEPVFAEAEPEYTAPAPAFTEPAPEFTRPKPSTPKRTPKPSASSSVKEAAAVAGAAGGAAAVAGAAAAVAKKEDNRPTEEDHAEIAKEVAAGSAKHENTYRFPPIDLLNRPKNNQTMMTDQQLEQRAHLLETTLKNFNVDARVVQVTQGASVTRYEVQPATGVKVNKITNLADDIALNMRAKSIRMEAPIPGKAAVGIEVENEKTSPVLIRELVESKEFHQAKSKISFIVGKDISGRNIIADLKSMPHLLIAGATGSGKSVCINTIITSILYKASPDEVKLVLIDPKVVELGNYNGIPHMLIPVVTDPKKAAAALNWAVNEMTQRYKKFAESGVKDLESYNELMRANQEEAKVMPQVVIVIDELADLMMAAPSQVEESICRLAQMARAAGMHLIVATQRPSVDIVTGVIKANIPSRIAFSVSSQFDSRTILDMSGAEKLLGKGDMLFSPVGSNKPLRVQGPFITEKETAHIIDFVKGQAESDYNEDVIKTIEAPEKGGSSDVASDELTDDAIAFILKQKQASVSMLQRRFRIGYNRAARIIDEIEEMGIIGPSDGSRPRQVLFTEDEYYGNNTEEGAGGSDAAPANWSMHRSMDRSSKQEYRRGNNE